MASSVSYYIEFSGSRDPQMELGIGKIVIRAREEVKIFLINQEGGTKLYQTINNPPRNFSFDLPINTLKNYCGGKQYVCHRLQCLNMMDSATLEKLAERITSKALEVIHRDKWRRRIFGMALAFQHQDWWKSHGFELVTDLEIHRVEYVNQHDQLYRNSSVFGDLFTMDLEVIDDLGPFEDEDEDDDGQFLASKSFIEGLKKLKFQKGVNDNINDSDNCAVCMVDFDNEAEYTALPGCFHVFHYHCIVKWLKQKNSCPIC